MWKAIGKSVAALAAAVAAALLALNGARILLLPARLLVVAVITSAVLAFVTTASSAWTEWRTRRAAEVREQIEFQLSSILWAIVDQAALTAGIPDADTDADIDTDTDTDPAPEFDSVGEVAIAGADRLDYRDLGLAVYLRRRRWWWPFTVQLVRSYRVRASHRPTTSAVRWRPGKGIIGRCVSSGRALVIDLTELYQGLGDPTAQDWRDAPDDVTMGLSYTEYLDLRGKYEVVNAIPITDERSTSTAVTGCVVLDGLSRDRVVLESEPTGDLLANLAGQLARQIR